MDGTRGTHLSLPDTSFDGKECCFCGKPIEEDPPDPCFLSLRTSPENSARLERSPSQELFCHAACLRSSLRPNFPLLPEIL